jgi:hypothetical protein
MESLLSQMTVENRKKLEGQSSSISRTPDLATGTPTAATKLSSPAVSASASPSVESDRVKREEPEMTEQFGQLALDEHGHGRFLGTSSTIALVSSFRALTNTGPDRASPGSPSEDGLAPPSMSSLYFPGSVMFGKVSSLATLYMILWISLRAIRQMGYRLQRRLFSRNRRWLMPL